MISLLVSDIKKMKKSSPSIYRDVHDLVKDLVYNLHTYILVGSILRWIIGTDINQFAQISPHQFQMSKLRKLFIFKHYVIMRKNTEKRRDVGYIFFNETKAKKETHAWNTFILVPVNVLLKSTLTFFDTLCIVREPHLEIGR